MSSVRKEFYWNLLVGPSVSDIVHVISIQLLLSCSLCIIIMFDLFKKNLILLPHVHVYTVSIHGKRLNTFLCFFHVNFPIKLHPRDFRCHKYSLLKLSSRLWISNICEYILNKSHHTEYKGTFTYQTEFKQTTCTVHNVQPKPSWPCQQCRDFLYHECENVILRRGTLQRQMF